MVIDSKLREREHGRRIQGKRTVQKVVKRSFDAKKQENAETHC